MTVNLSTDTRPSAGPAPAAVRRRRRRFDALPYALVTPLALFIVALALIPAGVTIVQSFYRVQELNPPTVFAGLENFRRLFGDSTIRASMENTGLYVVIGVILSTVLGIVMAVTLQRRFRGRSLLIAVLILPWALPGVVEGIVWTGIWDSNTGLLNSVLNSLHLISDYHVFLGQNRLLTIFAIELVQIWQMTPLSTLLILASLQNIPDELYEAAYLDGSSTWAAFRRITLPLARPGIAIAMVQALIATLNVFDQPYVLNGAAQAGASLTEQTYYVSFQNLDFGEGYALSLLITVATLVIALGVVKLVYRPVEY
ncbi:sugar ABC transporter permease [Actinoplanes sp. TBRC 11911]|uniref:carbohydrate ABC transporter permease n=1 Tax=Actinoplanes sp. TBRC 11911 TaxID=2729386 RepID=UPI00145E70D7|nr:sugar ABC transporter permease [Actinoplanes sp. TBRC 11911]NMO54556.1 sugar ABC transporter permease [Actinoplanes sp. TBRC 11911]